MTVFLTLHFQFQYTTYSIFPALMKIHISVQATGAKRTEENNTSHTYRPGKHSQNANTR
jgi:hypothetical protein